MTLHNNREFDPATNILTITTIENITHTFDITTGEITSGTGLNLTEPTYDSIDIYYNKILEDSPPPMEQNSSWSAISLIFMGVAAITFPGLIYYVIRYKLMK